ncbi:MAG: thioredoxin family protein [Syntrophobacteraceae bacterium]
MLISDQDAASVRAWSARVSKDLKIHFRRTDDGRSGQLEAFLDELSALTPSLHIVVDDEGEEGPPAIILKPNLSFQAVPAGLELGPFLDLLSAAAPPRPGESGLDGSPLRLSIEWPAAIKLYISPHCPHCPGAVSRIAPLALENPDVFVTIIDGALFPELAEQDGVRSAPTVLLDESFRWTGAAPMEELSRALRERDPAQLSAESLKRMLKDGQAGRLAAMILECGRVFPEFQRLLDHPEWSVRLGAVVVMEDLAEENRELARRSLEPVWERFEQLDRSVRGDVVYLSGLVGTPEWVPRIEALLREDLNEEMREVVTEALESLRHPATPR